MGLKKKIPQIKKDIKDFLVQEEGNMVKKDVVKIGMGLLMVGIVFREVMNPDPAMAGTCGHGSHSSHASHGSHSSHGSHGSHGSHSNY